MIATELAQRGFQVFPCDRNKVPLVPWKDAATTDVAQIAEWRSRWPSAMIGLPTGADNGIFVLDLDVDKETGGKVGEASLASLGFESLLSGDLVRTPSGGCHIYFQHFDGARNSVSQIGASIDTRGDGGYVVAPGSTSGTGQYVGYIPASFPTFPLSLRARLLQRAKPQMDGQSNERITTPGEVQVLLNHIDPDEGYEVWVSVLMALHARFDGSVEGLAIADQWSSRGGKYRRGEVQAKWRSFKRSGVTWATIPALARERGANLADIARRHYP